MGNAIFTNWETADLTDMIPRFDNHRFGQDFGFSNDPAALVAMHYDSNHKTIYIYNEVYERGMTNDVLAETIRPIVGNSHVTCDSSEPKSIYELTRYGIDARPAHKGKDSILHGIQWLQQHKIVVDSRLVNMRANLSQYKWREDKNGNSLPQPLDRHNDLIDALRYGMEQDMLDSRAEWGGSPVAFYRG